MGSVACVYSDEYSVCACSESKVYVSCVGRYSVTDLWALGKVVCKCFVSCGREVLGMYLVTW